MSYNNWIFEYQKILSNYNMLIAKGYKELLISAIDALLSKDVNTNIDLSSKISKLINLKSNLIGYLENDYLEDSKRYIKNMG